MAEIVVRDATADDAPRIARVHVRSWQGAYRGLIDDAYLASLDEALRSDNWRRSIERGRGRVIVAVCEEAIVGFAALLASRDEDAGPGCGEISAIYALADAWGRGVGRALMDEALVRLAGDGLTEVMLWVLDGNERAIRFYERAGFRPDGATKVDDSRGFSLPELRYRRHLPITPGGTEPGTS